MSNPLENFYRTKEIYVKLPTQGKWYKNPPKLSVNNEIGVMPMTIKDELILKIPDSLYNSEAIFLVLKSIVPDIDDPYEITIPDVDVILIASRAVTQGNDLGIAVKCPNCKEIHEYSINIPMMLSKLKHIKDDTEIEIKGLVLKLKPNTLATMTANSMQKVEIAKMKSMVTQSDENSDYSKVKLLMEESLQKMTAASLAVIADQISSVKMPDGTIITDFKHILEWIQNLDKRSVDIISENAKHLNDNGIQKIHKFTCGNENCNHEFETTIEFNPTFFFTRN
jgi:hypothetical protein